MTPFSTESINYLQRCGGLPELLGPRTTGASSTRRLLRVRGVGRPHEEPPSRRLGPEQRWRPRTAELITGIYGYRIPLAFYLLGSGDGVRVHLGFWSGRATAAAEAQDRRRDVLDSVLHSLYPEVTVEEASDESWRWPLSGLALGIPGPAGIDDLDGSAPIDRIIRALAGMEWAALVLAYPVAESALGAVREQVLNEVRTVQNAAKSEGAPSPLAEQYIELLKLTLTSLGEGMATGGWRTGAYLLGDGDSYPRLATAWRSVFSGERSLPEPVRVFDRPVADALSQSWALPDQESESGPGHYRRPFEFQTLLTTPQLAAYVHLPELETPGFAVDIAPRFDVVVAKEPDDKGVFVGRILHQKREGADYNVSLGSLTRHVFVAGTTGSGKTNTIFSLLAAADAAGVPFLVIEPTKSEYRALIEHPILGKRMRVFIAGEAGVSPFLINPFEVPLGTAVSEHLDLVRAAFAAAFGMWTPLPQILERCLHEIYADRGWDLRTNTNSRLGVDDDRAEAYPTLADLVAKAAEVIPTLGYENKITGDLHAALTTRLESLRAGGKGAMLDVARSLPMAELLAAPTVVELQAMGDEGDKAFLTSLILIRIVEHRRAQGQVDGLVHLLVVEEAHRVLGNVPTHTSEETANPRGQAVEAFSNLLSEIRAYGQGVVIADQIPVRLIPDAIKNTNLKIAHRTVSADDRAALGGAMAMEERQTKALTTLRVGEAAVFSSGDDSPLLVRIPLAKNPTSPTPPGADHVAKHMARWRAAGDRDGLSLPRPFCTLTCEGSPAACVAARRLTADPYVQRVLARTVLATIEDAGALDRMWDDLTDCLRARRPPIVGEGALLRAFAGHGADWYAGRRGAQGVWSYSDTGELNGDLRTVLLDKLQGRSAAGTKKLRAAFQATARRLHNREFAPYPACEQVCTQDPPLCLYRSAVADVVADRRHQEAWHEADGADASSPDNNRRQTWQVCQDAAYEIIEFPEPDGDPMLKDKVTAAALRVCICFAQQMLADDSRKVPRTSRRILARVLTEAGL
jgi:hypothetical protein